MLLMEFHGSEAGVKEQAETVQALAAEHGGEAFQWARTPEERTRLYPAAAYDAAGGGTPSPSDGRRRVAPLFVAGRGGPAVAAVAVMVPVL